MSLVGIAALSDVPAGTMKGFTVNQKQILLANVGGTYYAMDAVCPHMKGYLPAGKLKDNIVTCPVHGAQYDVTTGKVKQNVSFVFRLSTGHGAVNLKTYPVTIDGGEVKVEI